MIQTFLTRPNFLLQNNKSWNHKSRILKIFPTKHLKPNQIITKNRKRTKHQDLDILEKRNTIPSSKSYLLHLISFHHRVRLSNSLSSSSFEIKLAVMALRVPVSSTESAPTPALEPRNAHLLVTAQAPRSSRRIWGISDARRWGWLRSGLQALLRWFGVRFVRV